jgi:pimeloyl-ACP methyl ester carboxylesterase
MAITELSTGSGTGTGHVDVGDVSLWVDRRGRGPDVLLLAGLSDPAEAWEPQLVGLADSYRLTAFDNPGAGRTALPEGELTVAGMADDAATLLRRLGVTSAHIAGFSGGSLTAQELAIRHPDLVRSLTLISTFAQPDAYLWSAFRFLHWLPEVAPGEREMLEAFFLWIYTPRAHADGRVAQWIDEALSFPFPQPPEAFQRQLEAWSHHDTADRLGQITAPTLVVAGGLDIMTPPRCSRAVADAIPGARFVLLPDEAHQPFQESPEAFNALVDDFWREVDRAGAPS